MSRGKLHYRFLNASYAICVGLCSVSLSVHSEPANPKERPEENRFSVIILDADRLVYRDDKEVVFPNEPDAFFFGEVYQAHVRRIKTLSGPEVPRDAVIMFAGSHLMRKGGVSALKVFMVVRRDKDGYWGGQQWMEVGSKLCLDDDSIVGQKLELAFSRAKRKKTGERCIRV